MYSVPSMVDLLCTMCNRLGGRSGHRGEPRLLVEMLGMGYDSVRLRSSL